MEDDLDIGGLHIILKSEDGKDLGTVDLTEEEHGHLLAFGLIELLRKAARPMPGTV